MHATKLSPFLLGLKQLLTLQKRVLFMARLVLTDILPDAPPQFASKVNTRN